LNEFEKMAIASVGLFLFWLGGKLQGSSNRLVDKLGAGSGILGAVILAAMILPEIFRI
jgi:hypothetical protein